MNRTTKILWWVITLLVILNLSTIGTILVRNRAMAKEQEVAIVLDEDQPNPLTGRFFRQQLGFNDAQMQEFRDAHRNFQYTANELIFEMDSLKNELFTELNASSPDTVRLNTLSEHVGSHHADLKKITNDLYLTLRTLCDSSQCQQLQQAFTPLFRDGTMNRGRGYNWNDSSAITPRYRHRYGRNGRSE